MPLVNISVSSGKAGFNTKPSIPSEQVVPFRPFFQSALTCHTRREDRLVADLGLPIPGPGQPASAKPSRIFRVERIRVCSGAGMMFQKLSEFNPSFFKNKFNRFHDPAGITFLFFPAQRSGKVSQPVMAEHNFALPAGC